MACHNPIIPGFAPDPSIVCIEDTFYLVTSSFHLFPGLPIYASKDLLSWRHIGNAINRPSQLDLSKSSANLTPPTDSSVSGDKVIVTGGLNAPTIRHYNGITYIICTNVIHDVEHEGSHSEPTVTFDNFIIFTTNIGSGQWSNPVRFAFNGIDPDLFFDSDGRVYVAGSSWSTNPCTITCFEIDIQTGARLSAEVVIWGGHDKIIPEGPHIYKRNGYYYLLDAEGGTHERHRIAMARARSIWGPYESCEHNPLLRPAAGNAYCQYNGHGDLIKDTHGRLWMVCLGVRRDRKGRIVLGRETFLTPVEWPEDQPWPRIQQPIPRTLQRHDHHGASLFSASRSAIPSPFVPTMDYVWIRHPGLAGCEISADGKTISLTPSETDLSECTGQPISFVGRRQRLLEGSATVALTIPHLKSASELKVGLAYYKDEHRYVRIFCDTKSAMIVFEVFNRAKHPPIAIRRTVASYRIKHASPARVGLKIVYSERLLHFLYRNETYKSLETWASVPGGIVDTQDLTAADFTGPLIGVFAVGSGDEVCTFDEVII
ncbi:hypothetical protein BDW72DRAFT_197169 [Aspergillus terricola var. indicus]